MHGYTFNKYRITHLLPYTYIRQQKERIFLLFFTSLNVIFYLLPRKYICLLMAIGFAVFLVTT